MRRITLEVDEGVLFDRLRELNGSTQSLGRHIADILLAETTPRSRIPLMIYGIDVVSEEEVAK